MRSCWPNSRNWTALSRRDAPPTDLGVEEFFDDRTLVDVADDVHFAGALGADQRICFVHLSDEVRPALFILSPSA